jgi:NAD(P)-dependent dehydrogenase (short-subunit alcohol dehydrogenase family)
VAKDIIAVGGRASYRHLDVTSEPDWEAAVAAILDEFGRLDILVNNAGMGDLTAIEDTSLADWNRTIGIDQAGVFLGMKTAAAALSASGHGSVIDISSIFGSSGGFGPSPAYHAAKGAVRTLTKNIALHWADRGVRVNSVNPGFIDTPILGPAKGTPIEQAMVEVTPWGAWAGQRRTRPGWPTWLATTRPSSRTSNSTSTADTWPADRPGHRTSQDQAPKSRHRPFGMT